MTDTRKLFHGWKTVEVNGRYFARYQVDEANRARDYGCAHVLRIQPALDRQDEPGWYETYERVRAAIHAQMLSQN